MKIEIELTPGTAKRIGWIAITLAILGVGAGVYAAQTRFVSGKPLTAAALNGNFDELYAAMAKPSITRAGKSISVGGAYCGVSAAPIDVSTVGGYKGIKSICETACASSTAHICDMSEVMRSEQLSLTPPAQPAWVLPFDDVITAPDCYAWTNASGVGVTWSGQSRSESQCTKSFAIACCD